MILLALDQSTMRGSAALMRDRELLREKTWGLTWSNNQLLFGAVSEMLAESSIQPDGIDVFATGVGPGSFSGNRISLAAARAFALPGNKNVFAVSSGEVIACDILAETRAKEAVIIGDARRDRFWYGIFEQGELAPVMKQGWTLATRDELRAAISAGAAVASPDWDRLAGVLPDLVPADGTLIRAQRFPNARQLGLLAYEKFNRSIQTEPLSPIYLHPPVQPRS